MPNLADCPWHDVPLVAPGRGHGLEWLMSCLRCRTRRSVLADWQRCDRRKRPASGVLGRVAGTDFGHELVTGRDESEPLLLRGYGPKSRSQEATEQALASARGGAAADAHEDRD